MCWTLLYESLHKKEMNIVYIAIENMSKISDRISNYLLSLITTGKLSNLNNKRPSKLTSLSVVNDGSISLAHSNSIKTIDETLKNFIALKHVINNDNVEHNDILFNMKAGRKLTRVAILYQRIKQSGCMIEIISIHVSGASTMTVGLATKASLLAWLHALLVFTKFRMAPNAAVEAGPKELRKKEKPLSKILRSQEKSTYIRDTQKMCINIWMNTEDGIMIALSSGLVKVVIKQTRQARGEREM